ncbi:MAG: MBL fold metallo-hydrolase [Endomicrobia bacterium]|nr:MBL fold metallo-hydrolase [Endomicrobiia bacterium]
MEKKINENFNNEIFCFVVNEFATNCYIYKDPHSDNVLIIDPGGDSQQLVSFVKKNNFNVEKIILTHGHYDHVQGLEEILSFFDVEVYIHHQEMALLNDDSANLSLFLNKQILTNFNRIKWSKVKNNDIIKCGNKQFFVIHTPGHTIGSICLYLDGQYLFTGDTLFCGSVGRTDFPTGDIEQLESSLIKIFSLPSKVVFFPGHNNYCILGNEKKHNPFVKGLV